MADNASELEPKPKLLTPSDIAVLREAASGAKALIGDTMDEVGDERSGQLSPSHTPGRRR